MLLHTVVVPLSHLLALSSLYGRQESLSHKEFGDITDTQTRSVKHLGIAFLIPELCCRFQEVFKGGVLPWERPTVGKRETDRK